MCVVGDIQLSRKLQFFGKLNNVYIFSTNHTLEIIKKHRRMMCTPKVRLFIQVEILGFF